MTPFGFRVLQENAIVQADPWSSGECRLSIIREYRHRARLEPDCDHMDGKEGCER